MVGQHLCAAGMLYSDAADKEPTRVPLPQCQQLAYCALLLHQGTSLSPSPRPSRGRQNGRPANTIVDRERALLLQPLGCKRTVDHRHAQLELGGLTISVVRTRKMPLGTENFDAWNCRIDLNASVDCRIDLDGLVDGLIDLNLIASVRSNIV